MKSIFISYAWSENIDQKVDNFIKVIKGIFEKSEFKVIWDKTTYDKGGTFNDFMFTGIEEASVILCCCTTDYFIKSQQTDTGVKKELDYMVEKKLKSKIVPLLLNDSVTPKEIVIPPQLNGIEYISFGNKIIENSLLDNLEESRVFEQLLLKISGITSDKALLTKNTISAEFYKELTTLGIVGRVLPDNIQLEDIFVYPNLRIEDDDYKTIDSKSIIEKNIFVNKNIFIVGEKQSGKTTLAKKMFLDMNQKGYTPVFIRGEDLSNNWERVVDLRLTLQYENRPSRDDKIILIIDDFHIVKKQIQKNLLSDSRYSSKIFFVDDIFNITNNGKNLEVERYVITQMKPSKRLEIVSMLSEHSFPHSYNVNVKDCWIEDKLQILDSTIGIRSLNRKKVVPSYPIFLLTILGTATDRNSSTNRYFEKLSSFGHFYYVLITVSLYKIGLKDRDITTYFKVLSELSYFYYKKNKKEIARADLESFFSEYKEKYYLLGEMDSHINTLMESHILEKTNFGGYAFSYPYIYYYFLGMFFAQNMEIKSNEIDEVVGGLNRYENSQICIFIAHFDYSESFIKKLIDRLQSYNSNYSESTLSREELRKFEDEMSKVLSVKLPNLKSSEEMQKEKFKNLDRIEREEDEKTEVSLWSDSDDSERNNYIRLALQSAEVTGEIIKNRYGTISMELLDDLIKTTIDSNLRLVREFCAMVENTNFGELIDEFVGYFESKYSIQTDANAIRDELKKALYELNFIVVYSLISKTIDSIGSDKLISKYKDLYNAEMTPALHLIITGIELRYNKLLKPREIHQTMEDKNFSFVAKRIMKFLIWEYASFRHLTNTERQQVSKLFNFGVEFEKKNLIEQSVNKKGDNKS